MKIKLLTSISGPHVNHSAGSEADFPKAEAMRMIERGMAVPVREERHETAVRKPVKEKTVK